MGFIQASCLFLLLKNESNNLGKQIKEKKNTVSWNVVFESIYQLSDNQKVRIENAQNECLSDRFYVL